MRPKQSPERIQLMIDLHNDGMSNRDIGKRLSLGERCVHNYLWAAGIATCKRRPPREPLQKAAPPEIREEFCKLCPAGIVRFVGNKKSADCDTCGQTFHYSVYWKPVVVKNRTYVDKRPCLSESDALNERKMNEHKRRSEKSRERSKKNPERPQV